MKKLCCFFLLLIFLIANNCTGPKIELRADITDHKGTGA
jgi:hypothetical protein